LRSLKSVPPPYPKMVVKHESPDSWDWTPIFPDTAQGQGCHPRPPLPGQCPSSPPRKSCRFQPELHTPIPTGGDGAKATPAVLTSALKPPKASPSRKNSISFRARPDDQSSSPLAPSSVATPSSRKGPQRRSSFVPESVEGAKRHSGPQVLQYATDILGMKLDGDDRRLLHIAREGLEASLPPEWHWARSASTGDVYYIHAPTRNTQWHHPADHHYKGVLKRKRKHLACILRALSELDAKGWNVQVPGSVSPPLSASALLSPNTRLQRLQSTAGAQGVREDIHLVDLPPGMFSRLRKCSTTPSRPNVVDLGTVATGHLALQSWLELAWDGSAFTILLREHAFLSEVDHSSSGGSSAPQKRPHQQTGGIPPSAADP